MQSSRATRTYRAPKIKETGRFIAGDPVENRALDVVGSAVALIIFAPLMLLIAAAVFIANPGPVFFSQKRLGRNGKLFDCYKFRTMAVDAEERLQALLASDPDARREWNQAQKLRRDPRIVGIGNLLRKSSLDELPQLWNVLRGDMSLVGPRPIVQNEAARYGKYLPYYYAVKPGITGLWQINGRSQTTYRKRVAFDVVYVQRCQVKDNIKILALTVPRVLAGRGSY